MLLPFLLFLYSKEKSLRKTPKPKKRAAPVLSTVYDCAVQSNRIVFRYEFAYKGSRAELFLINISFLPTDTIYNIVYFSSNIAYFFKECVTFMRLLRVRITDNRKSYDWRNRPLQGGKYPYIYVDGIYLRCNWDGKFKMPQFWQ